MVSNHHHQDAHHHRLDPLQQVSHHFKPLQFHLDQPTFDQKISPIIHHHPSLDLEKNFNKTCTNFLSNTFNLQQSTTRHPSPIIPKHPNHNNTSQQLSQSWSRFGLSNQNMTSTSPYNLLPLAHHHPSDWAHINHHAPFTPEPITMSHAFRRAPKIYPCSFCPKFFDRPSTLATHQLTHTGEKPHTCATCGKAFSVASNLRRHEQSIHAPKQNLKCDNPPPEVVKPTKNEFVGATSSSILYQRGYEVYENLLPTSHHPSWSVISLHQPDTIVSENFLAPSL